MAWVAADRAVRSVEKFGLDGPLDEWRTLRDEIRADILEHGLRPASAGPSPSTTDPSELDAALLMMPLVGFLPADDERVRRHRGRDREANCCVDGFVQRYTQHRGTDVDGLPPGEGAFLACTFWLADNYSLMGRHR